MTMSRSNLLVPLQALGLIFLAGCGGGGGGAGSRNSLNYQTVWNGGSGGPTGISERITLTPLGGSPLPSFILDKSGNTGVHTFNEGVAAGNYLVKVELATGAGF